MSTSDYEAQRRRQERAEQQALKQETAALKEQAEAETALEQEQAHEDYLATAESIALQRELDLRDIREARANGGLSRSGLLAAEEAGTTLTADRRTAAARQRRQLAVDALSRSLQEYTQKLAADEQQKAAAITAAADKDIAAYQKEAAKAQEQEQKAQEKRDKEAESIRRSALELLYKQGDLSTKTYTYALDNGLTVSQAKAHQDTMARLERMKTNGTIGETTFAAAEKYRLTPEQAVQVNQFLSTASTVTPKDKLEALEDLWNLRKTNAIDDTLYNAIGDAMGISDRVLEEVKQRAEEMFLSPKEQETAREYGYSPAEAYRLSSYVKQGRSRLVKTVTLDNGRTRQVAVDSAQKTDQKTRFSVIDYLYSISSQLTLEEFQYIGTCLGLTDEDLTAYLAAGSATGASPEGKVYTGMTPALR